MACLFGRGVRGMSCRRRSGEIGPLHPPIDGSSGIFYNAIWHKEKTRWSTLVK